MLMSQKNPYVEAPTSKVAAFEGGAFQGVGKDKCVHKAGALFK